MSTLSRRGFLRLAGATVAGAAAVPLLPSTGETAGRAASAIPSITGAHLGVFAEPDGITEHGYFPAFIHFQDHIERGVDIYRTYRSWRQPIFNMTIDHILDPRRNPYPPPMLYISFHAFLDSKGTDCIGWSDIAAGRYDDDIDDWAGQLHLLGGRQTYLVFHHEMENEEGSPPDGSGTPEDFIAAYWYFRRRIEVVNGVPNLVWVITYMHDTFAPYLKHGGPDRWWPAGSPYGDVADDHLVGVDVYNRNLCHDREWRPFSELVDPVVGPRKQPFTAYRFSLGKERRLFIGECGCVEQDECSGGTVPPGTMKAEWFQEMLTTVRGWDTLEALCYSNVSGFGDGDYRITSSQSALDSFKAVANDPYFTS
jgi:hypothetical protein